MDELVQAYMRLTAAMFVSMFGSQEQRDTVGRLADGKLPVDEAEQVRDGLDKVARRLTSG